MTVAVILATGRIAGSHDPCPAAALPYAGGSGDAERLTLLARLRAQLATLNVPDQHIITRPELAPALREDGHDVIESKGTVSDLREIAELAARTEAPIVVLTGDLVTGEEPLARLLLDAKGPATALTGPPPDAATPVRAERRRIASAGSPYHRVTEPNAGFPGALRVAHSRAGALAEIAGNLASLLEDPDALERLSPEPEPGAAAPGRAPETIELLLVGLVRAGIPVAQCGDPQLVCLRADSAEAVDAARAAIDAVDEDKVRLAAAVKSNDGFFTTFAVSTYSRYIARWAALRGLTPNMVTSISMGIAVVAAVWFAAGTRTGMIVGGVLFYFSFVFDCVDGQLARYSRQFSTLGAWLDAVFDRAKEYVVFVGLAAGSTAAAAGSGVHGGDVWGLAVAALALQTVRHMIDFSYGASRRQHVSRPLPVLPLTSPDDGSSASGAAPIERPAAAQGAQPSGGLAVRLSRSTSQVRVLHWAKKIIVLPIGERFALIAITAALFNARVTFVALLVWGCVAAMYTLTGRVMRSIAR
ncbi:CDP-alcohol phosphatidyltransferase family protein [Actinomadura rudentiformis]|uniref:CDP-alcohol phosphatidyltransferase family protein n=1 Tax=Actinomadura rudentiformis TaxID=359158 RepID=A0A6H9YT83_9ACTN|nr:CDP-alcohol phosphatidyltransferase family protein [Actinomadura rudentiformis]KAB2351580.1 CDP-alcohol phosphatidyltransferase family protein [Actinomadura rudentiformis]